MQFSGIGNPTVRFGEDFLEIRNLPVRFGSVFRNRRSYGGVRCGLKKEILRCSLLRFLKKGNPTVRFGAVVRNQETYGAVRCGFQIP